MTERETIVIRDGGIGIGITMLLAGIILAVILFAGWYLVLGPGVPSTSHDSSPPVTVPRPSMPAPAAT